MPINRRKVYIDNLSTVLANANNRSSFISWALSKGINTFLYYGLRSWLGAGSSNNFAIANTTNAVTLGNFLEQARNSGIKSHVAVVGGYKEFYSNYSSWENEDYLGLYNGNVNGVGGSKMINNFNNYMISLNSTNPLRLFKADLGSVGSDFSGINLECEFWLDHTSGSYNGSAGVQLGVTESGYYRGYQNAINQGSTTAQALDKEKFENFNVWSKIIELHKFWSKPNGYNEAYVGWFKPTGNESAEATAIVNNLFNLNLHAYVPASSNTQTLAAYGSSLFNYTKTRLQFLAKAQYLKNPNQQFKVSIIYSMEPAFSGPWMTANPTVTFDQLHTAYENAFNLSTFSYKNNILIDGYTLFNQSLARTIRP